MYLGTRIVEFLVDIDEEYLRPLLTWDSEVAPMEKLKKAKPLDFASVHKQLRCYNKHG